MAGRGSIKDIDHGWKAIVKELKNGAGAYTKVGLQEGSKRNEQSNHSSMVTIGVAHEYGNERVPERSFLRSTHDEQRGAISGLMAAEYTAILSGRSTFKRSLFLIGEWFESRIKEKIRTNIAPVLNPSTIAKKRSTLALVDTGQMINSIRHVEVMPGQGGAK